MCHLICNNVGSEVIPVPRNPECPSASTQLYKVMKLRNLRSTCCPELLGRTGLCGLLSGRIRLIAQGYRRLDALFLLYCWPGRADLGRPGAAKLSARAYLADGMASCG